MKPAIKVESLGKKYKISHVHRGGYVALRDVIGNGIKRAISLRPGENTGGAARSTEEFWAVNDLSFEIQPGERVGIIGRNGAGKSTLLKLLSRITAPSVGRITLQGRVASLLEVGTGFHPELTGRENVYVNGSILGMSRREIRAKFDEIVAFSDVERFLDTPVKRYSSGMYMRLAFAVAAHLDPEILLVDEVLAVGDAQFQAKCLGKMDAISREGRTVLFVSHNMSAVATLCDRAILLRKGEQAMSGSVDEVVAHYLESVPAADDLAARTDRAGNGAARAVRLAFCDAAGNIVRALTSNDRIDVVLDLQMTTEALGKSLTVILVICDRAETRLFSLNTEWQSDEFKISKLSERLVCTLPAGMPLVPDHYSVLVAIQLNGIAADKISNAVQFEVVSKDTFGNGTTPGTHLGPMLVRHSWSEYP